MDLSQIVTRPPLAPGRAGEKLPWDDPGFSARMLREHLSQAHDRASRRFEVIDRQVDWLQREVLAGRTGRVLDLGCGPGLYCSRLARKGHSCVGIDFSPVSIDFARQEALRGGLRCEYRLADIASCEFGEAFDLVLLVSGELNTFKRDDATRTVNRAKASLATGGSLVLEMHPRDAVRAIGERPSGWSAQPSGLFSDNPHLVLRESAWFEDQNVSVERFFVVDWATAKVQVHSIETQAYTDAEYDLLLSEAGFGFIERWDSLEGNRTESEGDLVVYVARR